jgi:hypothetical protein
MVMNDAIVHLSVETLPFGGVGASGMGAYHGRYTFLTFSHAKSILVRGFGALGTRTSMFQPVLRIRIRIHRIHMFLGLLDPDPDPFVRGMDPDPSITEQK